MRSWIFRNLARLAALRGRPALPAAPAPAPAPAPGSAPVAAGKPRVRELLPARRRLGP